VASQEHSVGVLVVDPEGLDGSCIERYSAVWLQDVNARFDDWAQKALLSPQSHVKRWYSTGSYLALDVEVHLELKQTMSQVRLWSDFILYVQYFTSM